MNTETGPNRPSQLPQLDDDAFSVPEPSNGSGLPTLADNIAKLETDLDAERDERKEERFHWICAMAFMLDIIAYQVMGSFPAFLLVFMFQLVFLVGVAKKLGVDWAVQGIGGLLHWISERGKLPGDGAKDK